MTVTDVMAEYKVERHEWHPLGVITNGQLAHVLSSSAGEWGHVKIERGSRLCRCGGHGCVEVYLGADAILSDWRNAGGEFEGSG